MWLQDFPEDEPYIVIDGLKWTRTDLVRLVGSFTLADHILLAAYA